MTEKREKLLAHLCLILLAMGFLAVGGRSVKQIFDIHMRDYAAEHPHHAIRMEEELPAEERHPSITYSYYSAMNFR